MPLLKQLLIQVDGAPGVSGSEFRPFWLSLDNGVFTAGCGEPGCGMFHTWQDQHPHAGCNSVGLSTWDKHISFRNVRATSGLRQASEAPSLHQVHPCQHNPRDLPCILRPGSGSCHKNHMQIHSCHACIWPGSRQAHPAPKHLRQGTQPRPRQCAAAPEHTHVQQVSANLQDSREQEQAGSLVQACCRSILQLSTPHDLTAALTHLHGYASSLPGFHEALLTRLAGHLPAAALRDPSCVQHLSVELMAALLQCPSLVRLCCGCAAPCRSAYGGCMGAGSACSPCEAARGLRCSMQSACMRHGGGCVVHACVQVQQC